MEETPLTQQNSLISLKNQKTPTRNPYVVTLTEFLLSFVEFFSGFTLRGLPLWCNVRFKSHFYVRVNT